MRQAYMPGRIRLLLVAEAPPESTDRFFYNPVVTSHDSLFLETTKVLYPEVWLGRAARDIRAMKTELLQRFLADGFYLIDAVDERLPQEMSDPQCAAILRANSSAKVAEVQHLFASRAGAETFVVLIKGTVYDALASPLRTAGVQVPQTAKIPFPGSGQQRRFREAFLRVLAEASGRPVVGLQSGS
jgi:hypothetical protein